MASNCELCDKPLNGEHHIWKDAFLGADHIVHRDCANNKSLTEAKNEELSKFGYGEN